MIDIENQILTIIDDKLKILFPGIEISGENNRIPSTFPFVYIVEADNYTEIRSQDSSSQENHANLMYEIFVYSNKAHKKLECKEILANIDKELLSLGFTRLTKNPINVEDQSIYGLMSRYSAVVSKIEQIYRR